MYGKSQTSSEAASKSEREIVKTKAETVSQKWKDIIEGEEVIEC